MAKPVDFPQSNLNLVGTPEDTAAGNVVGLPAYRYHDLDGQSHVISCWELDEEEKAEVARTGKVWFTCWGQTHAPIYISGVTLFEDAKDDHS